MRSLPQYTLAIVSILLLWWLSWRYGGENPVAPNPVDTFQMLFSELGKASFRADIWASAMRIFVGIASAFVLAVPLGLLSGSSTRIDRWLKPLIYITYPIPKIVFLPVILVVFGFGDGSKIVLIALILFFHLLATTRDAARQIPASAYLSPSQHGCRAI